VVFLLKKLVALSSTVPFPRTASFDDDFHAYAQATKAKSLDVLRTTSRQLSTLLSEELQNHPDLFFVSTTGSDGRLEKSQYSGLEIVLVFDHHEPIIDTIIAKLTALKDENPKDFFPKIQIVNLSTDHSFYYQSGHTKSPFPTRALDSQYLVGNPQLFQHYRSDIISELNGPNLSAFRADVCAPSIKVLTGITKNNPHINLDHGILYYSQPASFTSHRIAATKYTHLRPLQYLTAKLFLQYLHLKKTTGVPTETLKELVLNCPTNMSDKLRYFQENNILKVSPEIVTNVISAYERAMYWFHQAEEACYSTPSRGETHVDPAELLHVSNAIGGFVSTDSVHLLGMNQKGKTLGIQQLREAEIAILTFDLKTAGKADVSPKKS